MGRPPRSRKTNLIDIFTAARSIAIGIDRGPRPRDERSYRQFVEALGVALYTTDAAGRITYYNEAASQLWGRRPAIGEEWCGSWRLFWPDGRPMAS